MDISFFNKISLSAGASFFKKREPGVLGIDLGSSSLKIVQLKKEKEKAVLETYGEISTAKYSGAEIGKSVKLLDEKVVVMLGDLMKEANITARRGAVSLPLRTSFVSIIKMPLMSASELKEAVPYEARRYIPVPIADVLIDFWPIPQSSIEHAENQEVVPQDKKSVEVLLVAIHRQSAEKYAAIFKEAGIEIEAFEIEIFSGERALIGRETAPVLIIDFGAQSMRLTIVDRGVVWLAHNVERGSQDLTNAISHSLSIDFERAEKLKRDTGLSDRPEHREIVNVIMPLVEYNFSEGLRVASEYRRRTGRSVKKLILTGGGAQLKGLVDFSINKFGLEAKLALPFSKVNYPAFLEPALKEIGPSFSNALGLAMRKL